MISGKKYLYDHGLPFSEKLADNLDAQIDRINKKRASMILIDGGVGLGKTTLATHIMDYINKKFGQDEVCFSRRDHPQIALGGQEFIGCFRACDKQKLHVVTYDEGGDFSKKRAITQFNHYINRVFETYRGFKILVIICLPNFNMLDSSLFDNQIPRMLLHLRDRNNNYADFVAFSLSQMNWIRYWFDKLPKGVKHKCYNHCQPNFRGHFLNLPPARSRLLDILSTYGKRNLNKNIDIEMRGLFSIMDISEKIQRSIPWIRNAFADLKIKPTTQVDRKNYYDKSIVAMLFAKIEEAKARHETQKEAKIQEAVK